MRKLLIAATAAGLMAIAAPAVAGPGPAGTSDGSANDVECGTGSGDDVNAPMTGVWVKTEGTQVPPSGALVVCNEGGTAVPAPVQGRVIAQGGTGGGYVAADGDKDNQEKARGYARVDVKPIPGAGAVTVRCGPDAPTTDNDAANPGTGAAQANCMP